jgi:hypothetical protein
MVLVSIMGVRELARIIDNPGCLDPELTKEHLKRLSEISKIEPEIPHEFLSSKEIMSIFYG